MTATITPTIPDEAAIPSELRRRDQWIVWRPEPRDGGGTSKVPCSPATGYATSPTDPASWATLADSLSFCVKHSGGYGIGFALAKDRALSCIDLDHVLDGGGNICDDEAARIVAEAATYAEVSPSGDGLHLWFACPKPDACYGCAVSKPYGRKFEAYDHDKFLTVTGKRHGDAEQLNADPDALRRCCEIVFSESYGSIPEADSGGQDSGASDAALEEPHTEKEGGSNASLPDDAELLRMACENNAEFAKLYHGDCSDYDGDHSRADLALCGMLAYWANKDAARMDRIFRMSALMRPKWDEMHGAQTYGDMTIAKAISSYDESKAAKERGADPDQPQTAQTAQGTQAATAEKSDGGGRFTLKIERGGIEKPPNRAPVAIEGILRCGHKMIVSGAGKSGKTTLLTMLAVAAATGGKWLGRKVARADALYIDPELDPPSFMNRVHSVCEALGADLHEADQHIAHVHLRGQVVTIEEFADEVLDKVRAGEFGYIILDSIFKLFDGDENAANDVKSFFAQIDRMTASTGAAFVLAHHTGKGPKGDMASTERARGSSVFGDDPDAPLSLIELFPPSDEDNLFGAGVRAFKLEGELREFPRMEPITLYADYPIMRVDEGGLAQNWKARTAQTKGGLASGEKRKEQANARATVAEAAILRVIAERKTNGITLKEASDAAGVTPNTLKSYIESSGALELSKPSTNRCMVVLKGFTQKGEEADAQLSINELDLTSSTVEKC